jgi:hypothetical protein
LPVAQLSAESHIRIVLRYHKLGEDAEAQMQGAVEVPFSEVCQAASTTNRLAMPMPGSDGKRICKLSIDCRVSVAGDGTDAATAPLFHAAGQDVESDTPAPAVEMPTARARQCKLVKTPTDCATARFTSETRGSIKIKDEMRESFFAFCIPMQLLSLYSKEDREKTGVLDSLGALHGPVQTARRIEREWALDRIMTYSDRMSKLDACGLSFKRSVFKKIADYDMVPTNLHLAVSS